MIFTRAMFMTRYSEPEPNQTLETNSRPASPLDIGLQFGRSFHAPPGLSGACRSACRSAVFGSLFR
jgi:hypothetical protein